MLLQCYNNVITINTTTNNKLARRSLIRHHPPDGVIRQAISGADTAGR